MKRYLITLALLIAFCVTVSVIADWPSAMIDDDTNSGVVIQQPHRLLHEGRRFNFSHVETLTAVAVKQATTCIPANIETGDTFTIVIGTASASYTALTPTVQAVVEGLVDIIAVGPDKDKPEFTDITWTEDNAEILATSDTTGRAFEVILTTTNVEGGTDNQTFVATTDGTGNSVINVPNALEYLITPSSLFDVHLIFSVGGTHDTTVTLYRDEGRTSGIAVVPYNRSGKSKYDETNTAIITSYPVGTTSGTAIANHAFGISTGIGASTIVSGGDRDSDEWILEVGGSYMLRVVTGSNSNVIDVELDWYEVNKDR